MSTREERNPKIDPMPGDVLCTERGSAIAVVDAVANDRVSYRLRVEGYDDQRHDVSLAEWRRLAANQRTVSPREAIGALEKERADLAEQLATVNRRIAFLRGEP